MTSSWLCDLCQMGAGAGRGAEEGGGGWGRGGWEQKLSTKGCRKGERGGGGQSVKGLWKVEMISS